MRNLSFPGILIEEGFLASLGMTAKRIFQQPPKPFSEIPFCAARYPVRNRKCHVTSTAACTSADAKIEPLLRHVQP